MLEDEIKALADYFVANLNTKGSIVEKQDENLKVTTELGEAILKATNGLSNPQVVNCFIYCFISPFWYCLSLDTNVFQKNKT